MIKDNLDLVEQNIKEACVRSGRERSAVKLIAVSKTKPVSLLQEAYDCGCRDFGENHVQEIVEKYDKLPKDIRWHMIGHLQKNKVKYIIDKVCMIHSVDSYDLAREISKRALNAGIVMPILIEVNTGGEESKSGISPENTIDMIKRISILPGIEVHGLMTVPPIAKIPEDNRTFFRMLYKLSVDINEQKIDNIKMGELSMGMSGDYQTAIEENATFVRVGTAIFGARDYNK
ncbi:MAG: YggS family pyridoxal phosphate-dependent enzyme [Lachnospiraceae bacterium]|jgi:pyridoxal phosphate enzyme (YggS family)|nr:YggS family pyridoxal phosphate-dependent enzyme [Lachnospiraceae bacterium]